MTLPEKSVRRRVKNRVRLTGIINNNGAQGNWFESGVERGFYLCVEADPNVLSVVSQPLEIHFEYEGRPYRHIPDAFVTYTEGAVGRGLPHHILYELKDFADLRKAFRERKADEKQGKKFRDILLKAAGARAYAAEMSWLYRLITNKRLGHFPFNAAHLSYYDDLMPLDHELAASILADVEERPGVTVQLLMQRRPTDERRPTAATVWKLLRRDRLYADLSKRLSNLTQVYPEGKPLYPQVW